jgi:hypothetical protein
MRGGEKKMIDVKRYLELKEKGLLTLAKVGDAYVVSWPNFDPLTGEKSKPTTEAFDKECIQKMKEEADALSASVASLLEDIDALESK